MHTPRRRTHRGFVCDICASPFSSDSCFCGQCGSPVNRNKSVNAENIGYDGLAEMPAPSQQPRRKPPSDWPEPPSNSPMARVARAHAAMKENVKHKHCQPPFPLGDVLLRTSNTAAHSPSRSPVHQIRGGHGSPTRAGGRYTTTSGGLTSPESGFGVHAEPSCDALSPSTVWYDTASRQSPRGRGRGSTTASCGDVCQRAPQNDLLAHRYALLQAANLSTAVAAVAMGSHTSASLAAASAADDGGPAAAAAAMLRGAADGNVGDPMSIALAANVAASAQGCPAFTAAPPACLVAPPARRPIYVPPPPEPELEVESGSESTKLWGEASDGSGAGASTASGSGDDAPSAAGDTADTTYSSASDDFDVQGRVGRGGGVQLVLQSFHPAGGAVMDAIVSGDGDGANARGGRGGKGGSSGRKRGEGSLRGGRDRLSSSLEKARGLQRAKRRKTIELIEDDEGMQTSDGPSEEHWEGEDSSDGAEADRVPKTKGGEGSRAASRLMKDTEESLREKGRKRGGGDALGDSKRSRRAAHRAIAAPSDSTLTSLTPDDMSGAGESVDGSAHAPSSSRSASSTAAAPSPPPRDHRREEAAARKSASAARRAAAREERRAERERERARRLRERERAKRKLAKAKAALRRSLSRGREEDTTTTSDTSSTLSSSESTFEESSESESVMDEREKVMAWEEAGDSPRASEAFAIAPSGTVDGAQSAGGGGQGVGGGEGDRNGLDPSDPIGASTFEYKERAAQKAHAVVEGVKAAFGPNAVTSSLLDCDKEWLESQPINIGVSIGTLTAAADALGFSLPPTWEREAMTAAAAAGGVSKSRPSPFTTVTPPRSVAKFGVAAAVSEGSQSLVRLCTLYSVAALNLHASLSSSRTMPSPEFIVTHRRRWQPPTHTAPAGRGSDVCMVVLSRGGALAGASEVVGGEPVEGRAVVVDASTAKFATADVVGSTAILPPPHTLVAPSGGAPGTGPGLAAVPPPLRLLPSVAAPTPLFGRGPRRSTGVTHNEDFGAKGGVLGPVAAALAYRANWAVAGAQYSRAITGCVSGPTAAPTAAPSRPPPPLSLKYNLWCAAAASVLSCAARRAAGAADVAAHGRVGGGNAPTPAAAAALAVAGEGSGEGEGVEQGAVPAQFDRDAFSDIATKGLQKSTLLMAEPLTATVRSTLSSLASPHVAWNPQQQLRWCNSGHRACVRTVDQAPPGASEWNPPRGSAAERVCGYCGRDVQPTDPALRCGIVSCRSVLCSGCTAAPLPPLAEGDVTPDAAADASPLDGPIAGMPVGTSSTFVGVFVTALLESLLDAMLRSRGALLFNLHPGGEGTASGVVAPSAQLRSFFPKFTKVVGDHAAAVTAAAAENEKPSKSDKDKGGVSQMFTAAAAAAAATTPDLPAGCVQPGWMAGSGVGAPSHVHHHHFRPRLSVWDRCFIISRDTPRGAPREALCLYWTPPHSTEQPKPSAGSSGGMFAKMKKKLAVGVAGGEGDMSQAALQATAKGTVTVTILAESPDRTARWEALAYRWPPDSGAATLASGGSLNVQQVAALAGSFVEKAFGLRGDVWNASSERGVRSGAPAALDALRVATLLADSRRRIPIDV